VVAGLRAAIVAVGRARAMASFTYDDLAGRLAEALDAAAPGRRP